MKKVAGNLITFLCAIGILWILISWADIILHNTSFQGEVKFMESDGAALEKQCTSFCIRYSPIIGKSNVETQLYPSDVEIFVKKRSDPGSWITQDSEKLCQNICSGYVKGGMEPFPVKTKYRGNSLIKRTGGIRAPGRSIG